jgi:Spy/CpxP family protein refolding chaperone
MKMHSLTARLGLATLALGAASALAFAQSPADPSASPPSSVPSDPSQSAAPAVRFHRGHGLTAAQQKRLDRLTTICGLSDIQKGQIKELMILSHRRRAQSWNDGAGGGYRAEAMNRRELRHEFRSILTPDQFAKLQAARAARRQAREAQAAAPSAAPAAP